MVEELGCGLEVGALLLGHARPSPALEVELAFYAAALPPGAVPRALGVAEESPGRGWGRSRATTSCDADRAVLADLERASAPTPSRA